MRHRRFATVDSRARITLGAETAAPGSMYRISVHPGTGTITLTPVEFPDTDADVE